MGASRTHLYLSRLLLNSCSRRVMSELAQPYEMHRTLMHAFPEIAGGAQYDVRDTLGVLFRADPDPPGDAVKVYVQSYIQPDWSFLDNLDDYLYTRSDSPGYESKNILTACGRIKNDQVFRFLLRANPTKRVAKDGDPMKGKRVELRREEEQIDWLIRKGQGTGKGVSGGFELLVRKINDYDGSVHLVPRVNIRAEGMQKGRKRSGGHPHYTSHLAVRYDGLLRVTDADSFRNTLIRGIGPGKAFGFGLLSVAPVNVSNLEGVT